MGISLPWGEDERPPFPRTTMNRHHRWVHVPQARPLRPCSRRGARPSPRAHLASSGTCAAAMAFLHFALSEEDKELLRRAFAGGSGSEAYRLAGSALRALLGSWGFTAERLGVESLDEVWPVLVREVAGG